MKIFFVPKLATSSIISGLILLMGCYTDYQKDDSLVANNPKHIELADYRTSLPEGEGVNLVESNCMICHSLQYINMQPNLPEKTWEKTVDKMIKSFGAPVADSASRKAIIKYLVAIKGVK